MTHRILVVDRNSGTRSQVAKLLERTGYETQQARTGREALEAARQVQPALVLLEVNLAEVSGYFFFLFFFALTSLRICWLASLPGAPITQQPGWVPEPHW